MRIQEGEWTCFKTRWQRKKMDIQMHHPDLIFYRISRTLQKARAHNVTFCFFNGFKECQGMKDVVLMYCQWFSIQNAMTLSPLPPIFYLRNHPHPPSAGVKITPGVNIPLGPVLYRRVVCRVVCAVCKLLTPSLPGFKDVQKGRGPCV